MLCLLCTSEKTKLIGTVKSTYSWVKILGKTDSEFEVYDCEVCDTRFVFPNIVSEDLYDFVFKGTDLYRSHLDFALNLAKHDDPSWALLSLGHPYYGILDFLKGKAGLEVLDIGCSYGSVVYIMNLLGHKASGIDISNQAIQFAKGIFGNNYYLTDTKGLLENNPTLRFDLVTAIEVIEHVSEPMEFIKQCLSLLKPNGSLLLTTPNKDYKQYSESRKQRELLEKKIWHFDSPPVHLAIYGEKAMRYIAEQNNCKVEFIVCPGLSQTTGNLNLIAVFTKL